MNDKQSSKGGYWYGEAWAEFFIAIILARIINAFAEDAFSMIVLLPLTWLVVHFTITKLLGKYATRDIFGRDQKVTSQMANVDSGGSTKS